MNGQGVILYNWGLPCVPRLFVALRTLRRHYSGPVAVMTPVGDIEVGKYRCDIEREGADFAEFRVPAPWFPELKVTAKLWVLKDSPFARSLVYENDFLFMGSPEPVFNMCAATGFGISTYHGFTGTTRGTAWLARRRWRGWPGLRYLTGPEAVSYNHGMLYMGAGHPFLSEWQLLMERWGKWTFAEEHIANAWCNRHRGDKGTLWTEVPCRFNLGAKFASRRDIHRSAAVHLLGNRHVSAACRNHSRAQWRQELKLLCSTNPPRCLKEMLTWDPLLAEQIKDVGGVDKL